MQTVFDVPSVVAELKKSGISTMAKVAAVKENADIFRKYNVGLNTLVICSPSGEKIHTLADAQCSQTGITHFLKGWKDTHASWQKQQELKLAAAKQEADKKKK